MAQGKGPHPAHTATAMNKSLWQGSSRWRLLVVGAAVCLGLAIIGANLGRPTVSNNPPPRASFNPPAPPASTVAVQTPAAVAAPPASQLQSFKFNTEAAGAATCAFAGVKFPDELLVYAVSSGAGRELSFQIDQSGYMATQFDIAVNSPSRPVVLMLGAYHPTIWNIGWTADTRIVAVLVSGYHRQAVAGLPDTAPILNSTFDNRGACGYFYAGKKGDRLLNLLSQQLFGRPVDRLFAGNGSEPIVVGEPLASGTRLMTAPATSPENFREANAPLAGPAGIDDAVAKGILRPATDADLDAWAAAVAAKSPRDVPPVAGQGIPKPPRPIIITKAYVVLKAFTYPAGLSGGHSATFFVSAGVPAPKGNPGHSSVYNFNTLECIHATPASSCALSTGE